LVLTAVLLTGSVIGHGMGFVVLIGYVAYVWSTP
jgi:hypothetical protein